MGPVWSSWLSRFFSLPGLLASCVRCLRLCLMPLGLITYMVQSLSSSWSGTCYRCGLWLMQKMGLSGNTWPMGFNQPKILMRFSSSGWSMPRAHSQCGYRERHWTWLFLQDGSMWLTMDCWSSGEAATPTSTHLSPFLPGARVSWSLTVAMPVHSRGLVSDPPSLEATLFNTKNWCFHR